jgi:hypothetical protein
LTQAQFGFLARLSATPNGALGLAPPHREEWMALEAPGYIIVNPVTRGDLSVRLFTITEAGRRALAELIKVVT